ncbi:MAG TPA: ABC transporter permease [Candidatus Angelobacter sp.]|nr:ABC transporter permease [Candidatus Angelobacter sp.]
MRPEHWIYTVPLRLRSLFRRHQADQELDQELRYHIEEKTAQNIAKGMSPQEARRAALLEMGGIEKRKEECRDTRKVNWLRDLLQDLRYGLRMLRKSPGFTAVAVLTLALGIGANTAIFSVVNAVLLKPLPYPGANRVVMVFLHDSSLQVRGNLGGADFLALEEQQQSFESVAAYSSSDGFTLTGDGEPEEIPGGKVTAHFFAVLGVKPMLGRTFSLGEDRVGQPLTVVVSYKFWREHLRSAPQAIGRSITINQENFVVIGVMPATFHFGDQSTDQLWPIMQMQTPHQRPPYFLAVFGRLKPGVSLAMASTDATRIAQSVTRQYPLSAVANATVVPMKEIVVGNSRVSLLTLLGAVGLVLLIAVVNVANLQMSRATARQKEIAIRSALGAGRLRLVRQLLTESFLLGAIGGALGLALAYEGVRAITILGAEIIPRIDEVAVDSHVLAFTVAAALLSSILFGLAPASRVRASRLDESLKESGRGGGEGSRSRVLHNALVVVEFSLATVLLIGAGLLIGSLARLEAVSPGFQPEHILTMQVALPPVHYMQANLTTAFYRQLLEKIQAMPGVQSAAVGMSLPPNLLEIENPFHVEGQSYLPGKSTTLAEEIPISEGYFRTLGVPLIAGRFFTNEDSAPGHHSLVINQTMADRYFGGDAVGKRVQTGDADPKSTWETIVGVVGNVKYEGLNEKDQPTMYVPYYSDGWAPWFVRSMFVIVRTPADPRNITASVRSAISSLDSTVPLARIRTMDELLSESVTSPRFATILLGGFAALALVLGAIGIYGVMSYAVAQRTHEIGVRLALGAQRSNVLRMVLGSGAKLAFVGIAIGIGASLAFTRFLSTLLFGVSPTDPLIFSGVAIVLTLVALLACYIPARRAMRVDPMVALRYE